jgi:2-polyprenyl-3-methyl-5-hydroxy-6-metoxy-1,4-benzoquinol methylase
MNDEQRAQIRNNAKYLRQVRPIDPEEIHEYVEGQPHPAAVRQVLREQAADLGLLEREDGLFEPVEEGPMETHLHGVDALPERFARRIEDLLVERFGPGWPDDRSGDRLRETIRKFKRQYLDGASVTYDELTALGYAIYHLPAYYAAVQYVLADLAADGLLPNKLRVLDVGAGVGGPALGMDSFVPADSLVEYHAVEPSEAATVLSELLAETSRNVHTTIHRERIEQFTPEGQYDLILCANVLSELDDPVAVLSSLLDSLDSDGSIAALSPADRNTAIGLRDIEREIETERGATIYAPTVRLWPGEQPGSTCWSFDRKPSLSVPAFQRRLDEGERGDAGTGDDADEDRRPGDGEFVNTDVQFAYSILRRDGKRAISFEADQSRSAKMAGMDEHVTERVDCVAIKLSHDLAEGDNPLFLIGDGSEQQDHFAVLAEESALNRDLRTADYGDLLRFENVLVLWNDDEQAYNLVVEGETVVDFMPT